MQLAISNQLRKELRVLQLTVVVLLVPLNPSLPMYGSSKLLLLLQAEERKQQALTKENTEINDTIAILRHKIATSAQRFGEIEWKLKDKLNRKAFALAKLQKSHEELGAEYRSLLKRYSSEVDHYRAQIDAMDKELWTLRGQPFSYLDRLQKQEDRLHTSDDTKEKIETRMQILEEQNLELTTHLQDAITRGNDYKEKMEFLQKGVPRLEKELAKARSALDFERRDKAGLEKQLFEMSQNITSLTERQNRVQDLATKKEARLNDIIKEKDASEQSTSQKLTAKERAMAKLEKKMVVLEGALEEATERLKLAEAKCTDLTARDQDMLYNYDMTCIARKRLLDRQIDCITSLTADEPGTPALLRALLQLRKVDLSGCSLANEELSSFLERLKICPLIEEVDVSNNLLTEEISFPIAQYLGSSACKLRHLNLRYNKFSAQALRRFAVALEHNECLGIKTVVLSKDGLVEAMIEPNRVFIETLGTDGGQPDNGPTYKYCTHLTVDMRDNMLGASIARPDPPNAPGGQDNESHQQPPTAAAASPAAPKLRNSSVANSRSGSKRVDRIKNVANTPQQIESRRAYRNKLTSAAYTSQVPLPK